MTSATIPSPTISPGEHLVRLSDHTAWLRTGRSLLAAADLIWPRIQETWDRMAADSALTKEALERGGPAELVRVVRGLQPLPLPVLVEHAGYGGSYLLIAGYGVENLLKAVRVKRLTIETKTIGFGGGDDRIPRTHGQYVAMAKKELGTLTDQESELLRRLSSFVTWAGRYPVSINPPTIEDWNRYVDRGDKADVDALCKRLIEKHESLT